MGRVHEQFPRALIGVFVLAFLIFAAHFLYFFVDDEGIAFVYARNLLRGDGLVYNHVEPRAEGYSNFLHVLVGAGMLAFVRAVDWPLHAAFYLGKALSILSGAVMVILTAWTLRQTSAMTRAGACAALATLVLSGPLGLWSASSLETVPFAAAVLFFAVRVWRDPEQRDWFALTAGAAILLWRIDGFVYIAAVLGSAMLVAPAARRLTLFVRYVLPLAGIFVAYTGLRWLYFGSVLTEPIATKVLYKLRAHGEIVAKEAERGYLTRFLDQYGWLPALAVAVVGLAIALRDRWTLRLFLTASALVAYVSVVGDWMYGFRFIVAIVPFYAVLVGASVARIGKLNSWAGWTAAVVMMTWASWSGLSFARAYMVAEGNPSWLAHPSGDARRYFWRYWDLYEYLRPIAPPGTITAYNQAGFIPFLLDLENIDNVGLCSRFVARLPTTDVFFTETGRYSPLTNAPALRTTEAYLLYRQPQFVIDPAELLRAANEALEPGNILAGRYHIVFLDPRRTNGVYAPVGGRPAPFRERRRFLENVAHVSHLRTARDEDGVIPPNEYVDRLPFLAGMAGRIAVGGVRHFAFRLDSVDVPVHEVYIGDIRSEVSMSATVALWSSNGRKTWEEEFPVRTGRDRKHWLLPEAVPATQLTVLFETSGQGGDVRVTDIRVQGQPPELREYLDEMLPGLQP